jgi:hypothetical protein
MPESVFKANKWAARADPAEGYELFGHKIVPGAKDSKKNHFTLELTGSDMLNLPEPPPLPSGSEAQAAADDEDEEEEGDSDGALLFKGGEQPSPDDADAVSAESDDETASVRSDDTKSDEGEGEAVAPKGVSSGNDSSDNADSE